VQLTAKPATGAVHASAAIKPVQQWRIGCDFPLAHETFASVSGPLLV
jgi:hypothetical protein